jgi:23S rRNA pseudouridine2605 synthase
MEIRLQKRIASSGYCSRRKAEALISAGEVLVNGEVCSVLGTKVNLSDAIEVEGITLKFDAAPISIALNKPAGAVTSKSDPYAMETVMDLLPRKYEQLNPIGRLDKDTEGLLLLSTDGALIQKLTHPSFEHKKTYEVHVKGKVNEESLAPLISGTLMLGEKTLNPMPFKIISASAQKSVIELELSEGRNRQIRRVMDSLGFPVLYLKRIAIGNLQLGDLALGDHKILTEDELSSAKA